MINLHNKRPGLMFLPLSIRFPPRLAQCSRDQPYPNTVGTSDYDRPIGSIDFWPRYRCGLTPLALASLIVAAERPLILLCCRRGLTGARIAKDEQAPVLVGDVDVASGVDQHILRLAYELIVRERAVPLGWSRGDEPSDFLRQPGILDVEDSQPGIEVSQIDEIGLLFTSGLCCRMLVL
jgi:hypothetical protein